MQQDKTEKVIALGLDMDQLKSIGSPYLESDQILLSEEADSTGPFTVFAGDIYDIARLATNDLLSIEGFEKGEGLYKAVFRRNSAVSTEGQKLITELYEKAMASEKELSARILEAEALKSLIDEYEKELASTDTELFEKDTALRAQNRALPMRAFNRLKKARAFRAASSIYKRAKRRLTAPRPPALTKEAVNGVSVIIPSYKNFESLKAAVASALAQTIGIGGIEAIVVINGPDKPYFDKAKEFYSGNSSVRVLYTEKLGAGAARNYGVREATKGFLMFLDDDDTLTEGFIEELSKYCYRESNIICGKLIDLKDGQIFQSTYINKAIADLGEGPVIDYAACQSLLSSFTAKLFRSSWFKTLDEINEGLSHTEDVIFWAANFHNLKGYIYVGPHHSSQAYIRALSEGSLSRPNAEGRYAFYIDGRLEVIRELSKIIFSEAYPLTSKKFALAKIESQALLMKTEMASMPQELAAKAKAQILRENSAFINKSSFASVTGIAFCHNFPPYADPSAYVAAKRLRQVSKDFGIEVKWDVYTADMSRSRPKDTAFYDFYAKFSFDKIYEVGHGTYFNEKSQSKWALKAFAAARKTKAKVMYSRSMWAGSHLAAYRYKALYPDCVWYAEFSDPIAYGADGKKREAANSHAQPDFWETVENMVYEKADFIIFTNENQKNYMLGYASSQPLIIRAREKGVVWPHPVISPQYARLAMPDYTLDPDKINIGYFGSWYENRSADDIKAFESNSGALFHIFTPSEMPKGWKNPSNAICNPQLGYFEFLSLASRMDYLYINDIEFDGELNPYLPSKLSDYLASQTPIIAKVRKGSALSRMESESILKVEGLDENFVASLKKRGS